MTVRSSLVVGHLWRILRCLAMKQVLLGWQVVADALRSGRVRGLGRAISAGKSGANGRRNTPHVRHSQRSSVMLCGCSSTGGADCGRAPILPRVRPVRKRPWSSWASTVR